MCSSLVRLLMLIGSLLVTASSNAAVDNVLARLERDHPHCLPETVRSGEADKFSELGRERFVETLAVQEMGYSQSANNLVKNCKNQVMKRFGVHFVTLASLDLRLPKDFLHPSIPNDEAGQCSELETLAAVHRVAGCLILVGDHKQLCCLP